MSTGWQRRSRNDDVPLEVEGPMSFAVLFPGQGSQSVGMGADLFDARPDLLTDRADDILGWSLRSVCLDGPEDLLTRTEHAQPALYALSYALWTCLAEAFSVPAGAGAGHSLGEYTALAAASAMSFDDGLAVVAARGKAMATAADSSLSGMAALIGADEAAATDLARVRTEAGGQLSVANINAPGQVVVAGGAEDIDWVVAHAPEHGIRRAIPLKVAGAFHTKFMASASDALAEALERVDLSEPLFQVWSNTTAEPHRLDSMRATLVRQVVEPVRFSDCLTAMTAAGADVFVHVGPGDVTAGMAKRTVPDTQVLTVSNLDNISDAVSALGTLA